MLQDCWPTLLSIAASWAASKHPALAAAAVHLCVLLFVEFEGSGLRQQLLQELHGHLGSGLTAKEDVALQVRVKALLPRMTTDRITSLKARKPPAAAPLCCGSTTSPCSPMA